MLRHRELVEGGTRLDRILKRTDGVLPLTPATLSVLFPEEAGSVSTARRAVRGWCKWGQTSNIGSIWDLTPFNYRLAGRPGRASRLMVATRHTDPKAAAEAVLGPLMAFYSAYPAPAEIPHHAPLAPSVDRPKPQVVRQGGLPDGTDRRPLSWRLSPGMPVAAPVRQTRAPPDG